MISSYSFGHLVFKNTSYNKDLIIIKTQKGEKVIPNWWRKEGHYLYIEDLEEVWKSEVEYLIIGTGAYGVMKIDPKVKDKAKELNIKLEAFKTSDAVARFNELYSQNKSVAGAFHLTC
ncbi:hypothetical protein DRN73_04860 [Candidatus Pacearchaeota archaeon]|nr:MAG: hypothetical protein DRN73_04860 [Candidatus Pacearchaeota archaeon]